MTDGHHHHLAEILERNKLEIARLAIEAHGRGPFWGIFLGDPATLGAETPEEEADLAVARERGLYVGVLPVEDMIGMLPVAPELGADVREMFRRLSGVPKAGHVHVLGILGAEQVTLEAPVFPEWVAQEEARLARIRRCEELLAVARPQLPRLPLSVGLLLVVAPTGDPVVDTLALPEVAPGVHMGTCTAAKALHALPLDNLAEADLPRARRGVTERPPSGHLLLVVAFDGAFSTARVPIAPAAPSRRRSR